MNTATKSILGQMPVPTAVAVAPATSTKALATLMLAAGVATLVVMADQMIDSWAESHVVAAWLALWAVAAVAIGVTRVLAQNLISGLDAWSAHVARRRADERLWAMAQTDSRLMNDLQTAMDRASNETQPANDIATLMTRRTARMLQSRMYYI